MTTTIRQILCPTDLSPDSAEALRYAVALSRAYNARLILCYCAKGAGARTLPVREPEQIRWLFINSVIHHLGDADFESIDWEGVIVKGGDDPAEAITREAAERGVDLIVMCSRRRPHAAALLGSTAESVCRTAPCPVLVTHPDEREWVGKTTGEINLQRVLVGYDFSDDSELALRHALSLTREYRAELHLLHVLAKPMNDGPEIAWLPASAETAYSHTVRRLQKAVSEDGGLRREIIHSVCWGKPYREILSYARENDIDLICMGAHGAGFGMSALFGSNVDRVMRQAPCPVLVTRPLRPAALLGVRPVDVAGVERRIAL